MLTLVRAPWTPPMVIGGPLTGWYVFENAHFHWGLKSSRGSEHTINGFQLPLEVRHGSFYVTPLCTNDYAPCQDARRPLESRLLVHQGSEEARRRSVRRVRPIQGTCQTTTPTSIPFFMMFWEGLSVSDRSRRPRMAPTSVSAR